MRYPRVLAAATFVLIVGLAYAAGSRMPLAAQVESDVLPGCNIPKAYGRLVTIVAGNSSGIAGQAVFEDADGTVRWVPFMFHSSITRMPKPAKEAMPAVFPVMPMFECTLGNVWKRH